MTLAEFKALKVGDHVTWSTRVRGRPPWRGTVVAVGPTTVVSVRDDLPPPLSPCYTQARKEVTVMATKPNKPVQEGAAKPKAKGKAPRPKPKGK